MKERKTKLITLICISVFLMICGILLLLSLPNNETFTQLEALKTTLMILSFLTSMFSMCIFLLNLNDD